jgi:hypothetical protein
MAAEMMPKNTVPAFALISFGWALSLYVLPFPLRWLGTAYFKTRPPKENRRATSPSTQADAADHPVHSASAALQMLAPQR